MRSWARSHVLQDSNGNLPGYASGLITLSVVPAMAKLKLQCYENEPVDTSDIGASAGSILPTTPKELACLENPAFWLAPKEWLFISADRDAVQWRQELSSFFSGQPHIITDLSDSIAVIELAGEQGISLLAQGGGIDFHGDTFPAGKYVATRLFQLQALVQRVSENTVFRIYVDRSEAVHLWRILERQAILMEPLITKVH